MSALHGVRPRPLTFAALAVRQPRGTGRPWPGICAHARGRLVLDLRALVARRTVEQDRNEKARCNQAAAHDYTSVHFRPSFLAPDVRLFAPAPGSRPERLQNREARPGRDVSFGAGLNLGYG